MIGSCAFLLSITFYKYAVAKSEVFLFALQCNEHVYTGEKYGKYCELFTNILRLSSSEDPDVCSGWSVTSAFTDTGLLNGFVFSFSINPLVWFVQ